jgi:hypothetical protein
VAHDALWPRSRPRAAAGIEETSTEGDVMNTRWIAVIALSAVLAASVLAVSVGAKTHAAAGRPGVDPADFTAPVENPYFPLEPGTVSIYRGTEDTDRLRERLAITDQTKVIQGVTTTVVHDVLHKNGLLAEKTVDWYAADNDGNVWYFGEATAVYDEQGNVTSTEGSWQAGVHGAVAGTIMPAHPKPTDAYRQELLRGHAEDQAWITQNRAKVEVAYGALDHVVRSFEWTRLESDVVSQKFYAPGLGIVREQDVASGTELLELVDVKSV